MSRVFDDRKKGYEAKFVHDAEQQFRITARRNRLIGLWAAERMQLTAAEADAYAKTVIQADFEEIGDGDVIGKLIGDLVKNGIEISDIEIRDKLAHFTEIARAQIAEEG